MGVGEPRKSVGSKGRQSIEGPLISWVALSHASVVLKQNMVKWA